MVQSEQTKYVVPDHDFPVGSNHKFIPSLYLICKATNSVTKGKSETSWKPERIATFVRSQLFSSSTAKTHMHDIKELLNQDEFKPLLCGTDGSPLPIWFISADGGPDENPRYHIVEQRHFKNIEQYAALFKDLNLDYLSIRCYAPGQSKYNPVERAMSSFSGRLKGVVLPHNTHGNHLSSDKKSISDIELAKKNFSAAAEKLKGFWQKDTYVGKPVFFQYVEPTQNDRVNTRFEYLNDAAADLENNCTAD